MTRFIMRSKSTLVSLAALFAATTASMAADMPPPPGPPPIFKPAIHDWSGSYVGAVAGGGFLDTLYVPSAGPDPELAGDGYLFGGVAGYNMQFDNIVLGVEGDISWGKIKANNTLDQVNFKIPYVATARLRVGYAHERTMLYATGGLAVSEGNMYLTAFGQRDKQTHYGYVIGGGIEHALMDNLNVRLEYLYGDFEKKTYKFAAGNVRNGLDNLHMVRIGVIWNISPDF